MQLTNHTIKYEATSILRDLRATEMEDNSIYDASINKHNNRKSL